MAPVGGSGPAGTAPSARTGRVLWLAGQPDPAWPAQVQNLPPEHKQDVGSRKGARTGDEKNTSDRSRERRCTCSGYST